MLAHTLCITAQKPLDMGGGSGRALYIDTEGTFDAPKFEGIAAAHGLEPHGACGNIDYCRVYNYENLNEAIRQAGSLLVDGLHALVVVDSLATPFRAEFLGRGELSVRQQELQVTLTLLQKTVEEYNVACLVTNHVMANPENGGMPHADPRRPVLGYVLSHRTQTIMYFKKGSADKRIVKLIQSPSMPEADAEVTCTTGGIQNS